MYAYVNKWARIVEKLQKNIPQSSAAAGWTKKIFLIWISNSYNGPKSKKKQVETNAKQGKFNLPACQTELPARSNTLMDGWTEWMHGWSDGGMEGTGVRVQNPPATTDEWSRGGSGWGAGCLEATDTRQAISIFSHCCLTQTLVVRA